MHGEHKFEFNDFLERCVNINIENDGSVSMCFISQPDRRLEPDGRLEGTHIEILVTKYIVDTSSGRIKVST